MIWIIIIMDANIIVIYWITFELVLLQTDIAVNIGIIATIFTIIICVIRLNVFLPIKQWASLKYLRNIITGKGKFLLKHEIDYSFNKQHKLFI